MGSESGTAYSLESKNSKHTMIPGNNYTIFKSPILKTTKYSKIAISLKSIMEPC